MKIILFHIFLGVLYCHELVLTFPMIRTVLLALVATVQKYVPASCCLMIGSHGEIPEHFFQMASDYEEEKKKIAFCFSFLCALGFIFTFLLSEVANVSGINDIDAPVCFLFGYVQPP